MAQTIGKNIRLYRERLGLTQDDLAQFLGLKREMVSYFETGGREVSLPILNRLADLFGMELADLLNEDQVQQTANVAFAFRANELQAQDLNQIAAFRKIVRNYIKMCHLAKSS